MTKVSPVESSPVDQQITDSLRDAVQAMQDRKASDLKVLSLEGLSAIAGYFLIASGTSTRQVQAIADAVEKQLRNGKVRPRHIEGYRAAQWILMDYGDFVIHVFEEGRRRFFGLDRLWGDALDVTAELCA